MKKFGKNDSWQSNSYEENDLVRSANYKKKLFTVAVRFLKPNMHHSTTEFSVDSKRKLQRFPEPTSCLNL